MKKFLLIALTLLSIVGQAQNPTGYLKQKLNQGQSVQAVRVATYAEMLTRLELGSPKQFIVENDENSLLIGANYYWDGFKNNLITPVNQWTGKKIVWCGTSIVHQFQPNSYPQLIGKMLGATVYNSGISGSYLVFNVDDRRLGMSGTMAEIMAVNGGGGQSYSYQSTIIPYLSAPYNADLVVIDHMRNDLPSADDKMGSNDTLNKATFLGALHSVCKAILTAKPSTRIVLAITMNGWEYGGQANSTVITNKRRLHDFQKALKSFGEYWGYAVIDFMGEMNINAYNQGTWTTDGLHQNEASNARAARIGANRLLQIN